VRYSAELATILTEASYSPCGLCVDEKGRRIGWKVKSARLIYDREKASVTLEQPSLELLGIPVAWLPWFWVPDPSQPRATGLRMPSVGYSAAKGAQLTVPFFVPVGEDIDIILSPTLMSRQGFFAKVDTSWRFPGFGQIDVKATGAGPSRRPGSSRRSRTGKSAGPIRCLPTMRIWPTTIFPTRTARSTRSMRRI
jgi:LPS-assembly protein